MREVGENMASTVDGAFATFMSNEVNLDPSRTEKARGSRDWLLSQLRVLRDRDLLPALYPERDLYYGSFARRTKIRPLDDIDVMICLHAQGSHYGTVRDGSIAITCGPKADELRALTFDDGATLNSRRVINAFVAALKSIPQYQSAEIKRNGEAATLTLSSYEWNFDITPCFYTTAEADGREYYLIPDGAGGWKKTDPRIDRELVARVNQQNGGNVLNAIRLSKYWNSRRTAPEMPAYLLETMVLTFYSSRDDATRFPDLEFKRVMDYLASAVYKPVNDPKGIVGDINTLSWDVRASIAERANLDAQRAAEARQLEQMDDHKGSIEIWRRIFGELFPSYG